MSIDRLSDMVMDLKRQNRTWEQVGNLIGISRALAWRVGKGLSDSTKARAYFGLPAKLVKIAPCRECGEVHQHKTCIIRDSRRRHRRAAEFTSERVELFDEMLDHLGQTLTEWMNDELDIWLEDQRQLELSMKYDLP